MLSAGPPPPTASLVERVRPPAVAGSWYTADATELRASIDALLASAPAPTSNDHVVAIVAPHAGYAFSGAVAATAFRRVSKANVARVLLIGPAHDATFSGPAIENYARFKTPLGEVTVDAATRSLRALPGAATHDEEVAKEHSLEMLLPFVQRALPAATIIPVLIGNVDVAGAKAIAAELAKLLDERTIAVVSSDFTHHGATYKFQPFALDEKLDANVRALDKGLYDALFALDPARMDERRVTTGVNACGHGALLVLAAMLPRDAKGSIAAQETSLAHDPDPRDVVGYVGLVFTRASEKK